MKKLEIISTSPEDTLKIANKIANFLKKGNTIVLTGELGAGKTKFVEGFLSHFSLENEISSPTFNIVNEYHTNKCNIYHFDVYRLEDSDEFYAIGGEEYFEKGICLLEWGEIISDILPKEYIQITFFKNNQDENERILKLEVHGNSMFYSTLLNNLKEELN